MYNEVRMLTIAEIARIGHDKEKLAYANHPDRTDSTLPIWDLTTTCNGQRVSIRTRPGFTTSEPFVTNEDPF